MYILTKRVFLTYCKLPLNPRRLHLPWLDLDECRVSIRFSEGTCWSREGYPGTVFNDNELFPLVRMPWSAANFVEVGDKTAPSFLPNNLAGDGRGRFAFAHGARVQCTRKHDKKQGRNDFTLAMK